MEAIVIPRLKSGILKLHSFLLRRQNESSSYVFVDGIDLLNGLCVCVSSPFSAAYPALQKYCTFTLRKWVFRLDRRRFHEALGESPS